MVTIGVWVDEGVEVVVVLVGADDRLGADAVEEAVVARPAGWVWVADVGETAGVVVRGLEREAVVAEARGEADVVADGVGVPITGAAGASAEVLESGPVVAAELGSMNAKTATAVSPPIQMRTRLGSGFQLPPPLTACRWRPTSRTYAKPVTAAAAISSHSPQAAMLVPRVRLASRISQAHQSSVPTKTAASAPSTSWGRVTHSSRVG